MTSYENILRMMLVLDSNLHFRVKRGDIIKEDVRRDLTVIYSRFLQGVLSETVETVKDESSLSCRLMWKTAHLQVLLVCMKVCFKISMKLTPVECHDGREVKGKVKLYVIGREVENRWEGLSEKARVKESCWNTSDLFRGGKWGCVSGVGALLLTHWSRIKGKESGAELT